MEIILHIPHIISLDFELIKPYFENKSITDLNLMKINEEGFSHYALGKYNNKVVGVRFGRPAMNYKREASGLSRLSHKSIPVCIDTGELVMPNCKLGYMVIQHFLGTPISENLDFESKNGRKNIISVLSEIVNILDYIHSKDVVHNDIHKDHILINNNGVYLIDFSRWFDPKKDRIPTTYDFCDEHEYANTCYGRLLKTILKSQPSYLFVDGLKNLANSLIAKPRDFFYGPNSKSRNELSQDIKSALEEIALSI